MARIQSPDYETVTAQCDHCDATCVSNQIDDIGEPGPYSGLYVLCFECHEQFWINCDVVNPAYKFFIFDAYEHFERKRYMPCIASLAQAWEVFFSMFAAANYLYRPFFATLSDNRNIAQLNHLHNKLYQSISKSGFFQLRNLLINTLLDQVHPATLQESEATISLIESEHFGNTPKDKAIRAFADANIRDIISSCSYFRLANSETKLSIKVRIVRVVRRSRSVVMRKSHFSIA